MPDTPRVLDADALIEQRHRAGGPMYVPRAEFEDRVARARAELKAEGFDALLIFAPESHHDLAGLDPTGFVYFQCAVLAADGGEITLLTRRPTSFRRRSGRSSRISASGTTRRAWAPRTSCGRSCRRRACAGCAPRGRARQFRPDRRQPSPARCRARRVVQAGGWLSPCPAPAGGEVAGGAGACPEGRRAGRTAREAMLGAVRPGELGSVVPAAGLWAMLRGGGDVSPGSPLVNSGPRAHYGRASRGRAI